MPIYRDSGDWFHLDHGGRTHKMFPSRRPRRGDPRDLKRLSSSSESAPCTASSRYSSARFATSCKLARQSANVGPTSLGASQTCGRATPTTATSSAALDDGGAEHQKFPNELNRAIDLATEVIYTFIAMRRKVMRTRLRLHLMRRKLRKVQKEITSVVGGYHEFGKGFQKKDINSASPASRPPTTVRSELVEASTETAPADATRLDRPTLPGSLLEAIADAFELAIRVGTAPASAFLDKDLLLSPDGAEGNEAIQQKRAASRIVNCVSWIATRTCGQEVAECDSMGSTTQGTITRAVCLTSPALPTPQAVVPPSTMGMAEEVWDAACWRDFCFELETCQPGHGQELLQRAVRAAELRPMDRHMWNAFEAHFDHNPSGATEMMLDILNQLPKDGLFRSRCINVFLGHSDKLLRQWESTGDDSTSCYPQPSEDLLFRLGNIASSSVRFAATTAKKKNMLRSLANSLIRVSRKHPAFTPILKYVAENGPSFGESESNAIDVLLRQSVDDIAGCVQMQEYTHVVDTSNSSSTAAGAPVVDLSQPMTSLMPSTDATPPPPPVVSLGSGAASDSESTGEDEVALQAVDSWPTKVLHETTC